MRTRSCLLLLAVACGSAEPSYDIALMSNPSFDLFACDNDNDGVQSVACGGADCWDVDATIHPWAPEVPNDGIDQDCNGADLVVCDADGDGALDPFCGGDDCDSNDPDVSVPTTWYPDVDGDGFRVLEGAVTACVAPAGFGPLDPEVDVLDCNDASATTFPDAPEICADGLDNGCDGEEDPCDVLTPADCDADGDGFEAIDCGGFDCLDSNAAFFPGAPDIPNDGIDQNCNGVDLVVCDADEDGVLDPYCLGDDCDSTDPDIGGPFPWFVDADGDGYAVPTASVLSCTQPQGYSRQGPDCDDARADVFPGGPEICGDGFDNDCDGLSTCDPGLVLPTSFCHTEISAGSLRNFGHAMLAGTDFNGDGIPDIAIAGTDPVAGDQVVIIDGTARGDVIARESATLAVFSGGTSFGTGLGAGDLDGDGDNDLAIGSPEAQPAFACGPVGSVSVFTGPFTGTGWTAGNPVADFDAAAGFVYDGEGSSAADVASGAVTECHAERLGQHIAATDLDNDGEDDLVFGTTWPDNGQSTIVAGIFHGPQIFAGPISKASSASIQAAIDTNASLHESMLVAPAGDINGDGIADLMVSHDQNGFNGDNAGAAWFFYGPIAPGASLQLMGADAMIAGEYGGIGLGVSMGASSVGDVDGDGIDDILIGEHGGRSGEGAVRLYLGPIQGSLDSDDADAAWFGEAIGELANSAAFAGDLNRDGEIDLVVGAESADRFGALGGAAYVIMGPLTGGELHGADIILEGATGTRTGTAVQAAGDVTNNRFADIAVAAPSANGGSVFLCGATP